MRQVHVKPERLPGPDDHAPSIGLVEGIGEKHRVRAGGEREGLERRLAPGHAVDADVGPGRDHDEQVPLREHDR